MNGINDCQLVAALDSLDWIKGGETELTDEAGRTVKVRVKARPSLALDWER